MRRDTGRKSEEEGGSAEVASKRLLLALYHLYLFDMPFLALFLAEGVATRVPV